MFTVTEPEIDEFATGNLSIDFGLFTLCVGVFVAFLVVVTTVTQIPDKIFATFVALLFVSVLGIVFFGYRTWRERRRSQQRIAQIKESRKV
jgi:threonine/homoserine/homoserine lactone efflux protein